MSRTNRWLSVASLVIFISSLFLNPVISKVSLPPAGNNGNPTSIPPGQTCAQCHSGSALMNGDALAEIKIGETSPDSLLNTFEYDLNKNYTLSFSPQVTGKRFGFQLSALSSSNQNAGSLSLINTTNTSLLSTPITYIGHKDASSFKNWTFSWLSPNNVIGDITFYYSFVAADSNNESTNDTVYKGSVTIHPLVNSLGPNEPISNLNVFPNPVKNYLTLSFSTTNCNTVEVNLFTQHGQLVKNMFSGTNESKFNRSFHLNGLASGIYLLHIRNGTRVSTEKIIIE
ncbi:MAG: choice-of-anchor V domain-containing protein [Chitinophagales bacterium]